MQRIHGTCVLLSGVGVLLRGPSGSGKSDLALRLIDGGGRLIADDQVELQAVDGRIVARAPTALFGLLEVRGVGILRVDAERQGSIGLVIDLAHAEESVERLPDVESVNLAGTRVRRLVLHPFHASTPAKVRLAAERLAAGMLDPAPGAP